MRLSPLSQVRSAITGKNRFPVTIRQIQIYEAEFAREKEAVEDNEAEAREVLSLSYQIRGLPEADAVRFVNTLRRTKSNSSGHSRESD